MSTEKMMQSALEHGMDLEGAPVAYEFYNPATGHSIVDYTRWTHAGHLTEEAGYLARPLAYARGGALPSHVHKYQPVHEGCGGHYLRCGCGVVKSPDEP